jgi:hypothetical protein
MEPSSLAGDVFQSPDDERGRVRRGGDAVGAVQEAAWAALKDDPPSADAA